MHLLLDHEGYLPSFAVVTDGKYSELKVARSLPLEAGTILAIDRGYNDYVCFGQLTRDGIFFVTRMKSNTVYSTVKSFLGASANAVKTQIWTALIAMLILKYLQMKSSFGWSLSNLAALLRQQLFIFRDLWAWLNNPLEGPPAARQLAEQLPMPLVW